jgi:hypothetical protein
MEVADEYDEFYEVRAWAKKGLRERRCLEGHPSAGCQLLILPSFENPVCWDVLDIDFDDNDTAGTRLHRTCWRMDVDSEALNDPIERLKHPRPYLPTMETDSADLDRATLQAVLAKFSEIPMRLNVKSSNMGCDGTTFEFACGHYFWNARLRWWNELPAEWQSLREPLQELQDLFESAWKQKQ